MWVSPLSTPNSAPGRRLSIWAPSVRASIHGLRALLDRIESKQSFSGVDSGSLPGNCQLPLSRSQSHLLADLVTTLVGRLTWWSTREENDSWVLFGDLGGDSGPQVTVFISATSDKDVLSS